MGTLNVSPVELADHARPFYYSATDACATGELACVSVYKDAKAFAADCAAAGYTGSRMLQYDNVVVGLCWTPDVLLITWRGSDDPKDWKGNCLSAFRRPYRELGRSAGSVGAGWLPMVRKARGPVLRVLDGLLEAREVKPDVRVLVGGHSLGGPLAAIFSAWLVHTTSWTVSALYLHDPPRSGNATFAKFVASQIPRTYTVVHVLRSTRSLVSRVPLYRTGARHLGEMALLTPHRVDIGTSVWHDYRRDNPTGWWESLRVLTRLHRSTQTHKGLGMANSHRAAYARNAGRRHGRTV